MKQRILLALCLMTFVLTQATAMDGIGRLDSLLTAYEKSDVHQRTAIARDVIAMSQEQDDLADSPLTLSDGMPRDSVDLLVWFAAERFYYCNSYFEESLTYIDRALALAGERLANGSLKCRNNPELVATLLCDRGYCLFKTGRNAEATKAEMHAKRFAQEHGQLLSLARAYNYMAIIDISLGYTDEAKHFVEKALETDALTGSDRNTHNYLGIACEVYNVAKEPDRAVEYGIRAVEAARRIGYDAGVVNHLSQLSYAYNRQGNLEKALEMSLQAVSTVEQMPIVDRNLLAISLEYVAYNLLDMKRNDEAVPVIRRAIALQQEVGNTRSVCYDHKSLAEALEPSDPRGALAALRRYSQMMDSLHYDEMHTVLGRANAELHNDELQDENSQERRQKRLIITAFLIAGLLALAVIAALAYAIRTRNRTVKAVRQLQAVREEFFTNITHEFRTPLTVIRGLAEQQGIVPIVRNADQLLELVNQLLDIAKVKAAVGDARWERSDIVPLLTMLVESHQPAARQKGITIYVQAEPTAIVVDHVADYVQKVVNNLLSNAMKYTPEGGTVILTTHVEGEKLQLVVADNGQGIHQDDLPHIFDPFYQSRHTTAAPGTGIGLAFCHELVVACGGTITAESTLGKGTAFTIIVPLRRQGITSTISTKPTPHPLNEILSPPIANYAPDSHADGSITEADGSSTEADSSKTRILVVDDNADVAAYIGSVLEPTYEVIYAADGEQGLAKAEELVPDVILTDVMMPAMDGLELCRRIRANLVTDHIPVIVITARVTDDDRLQGFEAGADAYLTKPFRADELLLRIAKILEQRKRLKEKLQPAQPAPVPVAHPTPKPSKGELNASAFLKKLDDIIQRQMVNGDIRTTAVANEMCMSLSQFTRKLNNITGTSPAAYITRRRLEEACRMLKKSPKKIADVATHCGFADVSHFSHVFRRVYGISPKQYIEQLSQGDESLTPEPETHQESPDTST